MLAFVLLAAATPFGFHVDAAEFPNVVYHLSCLSESISCTQPAFETFWRDDLRWTSTDQRQLDAWKAALSGVARRQPSPRETPFVPNLPAYYPGLTAVRRIIAAGFGSRSPAGFRKRAAALASPSEIVQLTAALEHFQRRLRPWWRSRGERYAAARRGPIQARMNAPSVTALGERIVRFMESEITSREFRVHLIPRSDPQSDAATATYVGNHLVMELTDAMKPDSAAGVLMHELTHVLYDRAPLPLHEKLMHDFMAASEPQSQARYAILNEGIAAGVQFDVTRRTGQSDQEVYRHPFIPRIGRAVSAPLARALESGPPLFHGFLESYLRAGAAELKEEMASPKFILSSVALAQIGELDEAAKAYHSEFATVTWADFADRDRYPEVNLVILVTYDKLDAVAGNRKEIVPLSQRHRGFAFSSPRKRKGRVYVLAGRDDRKVAELVRRLAAIRTGTGDGLVLSIDY